MQKITPCLWFGDKAEEAAKFYVSVFKNSKLGRSPATEKLAPKRPEGRKAQS